MIRPSSQATTMFFHQLFQAEGLKLKKGKMLECLYLADRMSLLEIGRTITRDKYLVKNGKIVMPECEKSIDHISEHFKKTEKIFKHKKSLKKTIESYLAREEEEHKTYQDFLKLQKDFDLALQKLSDSDLDCMIKAFDQINDSDFNIYDLPEFKNCGAEITPKEIVLKSDLDQEMKDGILESLQIEAFFEDLDSDKKKKEPERD